MMVKRSISRVATLSTAAAVVVLATTAALQVASSVPATAATGSDPLYAWGYNQDGQLGDGTSTGPERCAPLSAACSTTPVQVALPPGVTPTAIAGGGGGVVDGSGNGYAIGSDGKLYAWGFNGNGELGDGNLASSDTPVPVALPRGITPRAIAAGFQSGYAIGSDGKLYAWGFNGNGQLGDGNLASSDTPVMVSLPSGVSPKAIAGGTDAGYAIGSDLNVYAWGYNGFGQLGDGNLASSDTPVVVSLPSGVTPKAVAGGGGMGYAIGSNDRIYAWGENGYGQLGNGTSTGPDSCFSEPCSTTPVLVSFPSGVIATAVAGGGYDGYAIGSDRNVYAWGLNDNDELGNGTSTGPEKCAPLSAACSTTPVRVLLPSGVTAKAITGGDFSGYAIGSDQTAYAWGYNQGGELGDGNTTSSNTPVRVSLPPGSTPQDLSSGSSSGSGYAVVSQTPTSTTLTSTPAVEGQTTTLTATVRPGSGGGTPTGSVTFADMTAGKTLGSAALRGGVASLKTVFSEEGSHAITASYGGDANFHSSSTAKSISVADAPLTGQAPPAPLQGREGVPFFAKAIPVSGVVGSFTDADPAGTASDYSATIAWGDGTTSVGTISASGSGFPVTGSHTYKEDRNYPITVHIADVGGSTVAVNSSAHVSEPRNFLAFLVDLFFERFGF